MTTHCRIGASRFVLLVALSWALMGFDPGVLFAQPGEVVGTWKYQDQNATSKNWQTMCWYQVKESGGKLSMSVIEYSITVRDLIVANSFSDIKATNTEWTFSADWGSGNKGKFQLKKTDKDNYEGAWTLNGKKQPNSRRLQRIADNRLRNEIDLLLAQWNVTKSTSERILTLLQDERKQWEKQAEESRKSGGTGAQESIYLIQTIGRIGRENIWIGQINERIRAATAEKVRLEN